MNGLLVDENLPESLVLPTKLRIIHATSVAASPSDSLLWAHALQHGLVLVTKDADFTPRIMLAEPPPWVVHVRLGNLRLRDLRHALEVIWPTVETLLPQSKLITVLPDRIEAVA